MRQRAWLHACTPTFTHYRKLCAAAAVAFKILSSFTSAIKFIKGTLSKATCNPILFSYGIGPSVGHVASGLVFGHHFASSAGTGILFTVSWSIRIFNCIEEVPRFFFPIEFNSAFQISNYLQFNCTPDTV